MDKQNLVAACLLCLLAGCGSVASDLIPVAGQVVLEGKPLASGTVSLRPDAAKGNASQHQPTGPIDAQGRYEVYTTERSGVSPGWYKVVVFATSQLDDTGKAHPGMPQSIIHLRYNGESTTPLALEVKADAPAGSYDLRLEN